MEAGPGSGRNRHAHRQLYAGTRQLHNPEQAETAVHTRGGGMPAVPTRIEMRRLRAACLARKPLNSCLLIAKGL